MARNPGSCTTRTRRALKEILLFLIYYKLLGYKKVAVGNSQKTRRSGMKLEITFINFDYEDQEHYPAMTTR